jgi:Na+/H+ antiporter NhaD/arsenite permease-like protein
LSVAGLGPLDPSIYISLAFLFGIAAQFRAMDGDAFLRRVLALVERRVGILYAVSIVTAVVSPFVLNDVLIVIFTPAVIAYARRAGIDAAPLVVAEVTFANVASSITPFGNPQNILLWTSTKISVESFFLGTWARIAAATAIAALAMVPFARRRRLLSEPPVRASSAPGVYLGVVAASVVALDFAHVPSYVPLGLGFALGFVFTYRAPGRVAREFDARSLLVLWVFVAAVSVASLALSGYLEGFVRPVAEGIQPYSSLFFAISSNVISNVPATQLVLSNVSVAAQTAPRIAVEAGLSGNLGPIASFANLLAIQMARREGVDVKRVIALQIAVGILVFLPALAW